MKYTKAVLIILALVLLSCSGCSTITFGYNHADLLLRYMINGYTSFDAEQKKEIHRDIDEYLRWHRQHALPEYIAFLQKLNAAVHQDALTADDVMRAKTDIRRLYRLTMEPSIQPAAHLLSTLDGGQIEEVRQTLADGNRKIRKETLSGSEEENLSRRAQEYVKSVERLAGDLNREQKKKVMALSRHIPFVNRYYIEQREAEQAILISMLNDHAGEDKIAAMFHQWLDTPDAPASAQEQQTLQAYDRAMNEMIVKIFELLTPHQRDHLRKNITGYINDLNKFHAAAE